MDKKILLLKQLVDRTGAKIVLSSTWRYGWVYMDAYTSENDAFQQREIRHFIALREKLREFGLEIFSRTPVSELDFRGAEIDQWLQEWEGEPIESFVIIDDMDGRYLRPHSNRFVQTSLQKADAEPCQSGGEDIGKAIYRKQRNSLLRSTKRSKSIPSGSNNRKSGDLLP